MFDGRDKEGLNVLRSGHDWTKSNGSGRAMPFPFSSRNAQHTESRDETLREVPFTEVSFHPETSFYALLKQENTPYLCVSLSRESLRTDTLSTTDYASVMLIRISNFYNLVKGGKREKLSSESANRYRTSRRRLPRRMLKFTRRRCCNIAKKSHHPAKLDAFFIRGETKGVVSVRNIRSALKGNKIMLQRIKIDESCTRNN